MKDKKNLLKPLDGWNEVFITDPLTAPLGLRLAKFSWVHPLFFTLLSFLSKLSAAILIFKQFYWQAGLVYWVSILFDGLDGKIARLQRKNILLHGVLDIVSDQVANTIILLIMTFIFSEYQLYFILFLAGLYIYEVTLCLRSDMRCRFIKHKSWNNVQETINNYTEVLQELPSDLGVARDVIKACLYTYQALLSVTRRFRTYPYPTIVDAEFLLFVVFLITQKPYFVFLSVLFLLPDVLNSFILTTVLALRFNKV